MEISYLEFTRNEYHFVLEAKTWSGIKVKSSRSYVFYSIAVLKKTARFLVKHLIEKPFSSPGRGGG